MAVGENSRGTNVSTHSWVLLRRDGCEERRGGGGYTGDLPVVHHRAVELPRRLKWLPPPPLLPESRGRGTVSARASKWGRRPT